MGFGAKLLTKAVGAGALYLGLKDAHICGIAGKNKNPQAKIAQRYPDMYINSQRMDTLNTMPVITSQVKNAWFNLFADDTIMGRFHAITGYLSGLMFGLVNNVVPLALGAGAALLKRGGGICAALLGLGATVKFLTNVTGMDSYKKI